MSSIKTFISNHTNNNNNNNNSNINCVKINYFSSLIATCGNDGKINIFSYKNQNLLQTLQNHSDSIWDLSFSFPFKNYGEFLASCGFDNKLNIYKNNNNNFNVVYSYSHKSSINSCEFCPKEYGIILLCCSSDNSLSLHELNTKNNNNNNNNYNFVNKCYFTDYVNGINAISFGPSLIPILFDEDENNDENNNINNEEALNSLPVFKIDEKFMEVSLKKENKNEQFQKCVICMEKYMINDEVKTLPCFHLFHKECIDHWLKSGKDTCPICKNKINNNNLEEDFIDN